MTLLPGLIDCHTHLLASSASDDYGTMLLTKSTGVPVLAVAGNPLADVKALQHVSFVMKGGLVVEDKHKPAK